MLRRGVVTVGLVLLSCAKPVDPCAGIDCGDGRCVPVDGAAACLCAQGFVADALRCVPADLCASSPCAGLTHSLCQLNASSVSCVCPESLVEQNGSCVPRTPCVPNPCQNVRRTSCEIVDGAAQCLCDPGYAPEGAGCGAVPVWNCAAQHAGGDAAEPDECPALAHSLVLDQLEARTLEPLGDQDWFEIAVTPGRLFGFSATSTALPLLIEVFDPAGVNLLASDNRGTLAAEVTFLAPDTPALMVRVREVGASAAGAYSVQYRDLGTDDFVNTNAGAITLVPDGVFQGSLQYAADRDVAWLEMPAMTAVRLQRADAGAPNVVLEVARPDGGARELTLGEGTTLTTAGLELVSLTASGRSPRDRGDFSVSFTALGPDDHSDDPTFATVIVADAGVVSGVLERPSDVDFFSVAQVQAHLYEVHWSAFAADSCAVFLADGQLAVRDQCMGNAVWKANGSRPAALMVKASSVPGTPVHYTVAVDDLGLDDHGDTFVSATPATLATPIAGRIEQTSDVDTFTFTASAGRIFRARAAGVATGVLRVRLSDAAGVVLDEGNDEADALIATSGVYMAQVRSNNFILVDYALTVSDEGVDDHADNSAAASALTIGTPSTGSIQHGTDFDDFAFMAIANHFYDVNCAQGGAQCSFQVWQPGGVQVSNGHPSTRFLATVDGRYLVEIGPGSSFLTRSLGPYALTVNDLGPEDHGATIAAATALQVGTPATGGIDFSLDVDVFSFPATAGHVYAAEVIAQGGSVTVQARTANNTVLASSYGTVSFLAPSSALFYVFVSGYAEATYSVNVTDRGLDDHANTAAGAAPIAAGAAQSVEIQYQGDLDWVSLPVVAGHEYQAACTGGGLPCAATVVEANGNQLTPPSSSVAFKAPLLATTVFLQMSSNLERASYSLLVTDMGADDFGDTSADATSLTVNAAAVSGVLETTADQDAFTVSVAAGEIGVITCTTTSGTGCGLSLTAPSGLGLGQSTPRSFARTAFLAGGAGAYLVQVSGGAGTYSLGATLGSDDFMSTTALTLGATRAGAIDYIGDVDIFSIALTAGQLVQVTLSNGVQVDITSPSGDSVVTRYGGTTSPLVPSASGTWRFSVSAGLFPGIASYAVTVQ